MSTFQPADACYLNCLGNFLSIERGWSPGDRLVLLLPMGLRLEKIQGIHSAHYYEESYGCFQFCGNQFEVKNQVKLFKGDV